MSKQDKYTYRITWGDEDGKYVATVVEMLSFSWLADTPDDALQGLRAVVDEVIEDMEQTGEIVPIPFTERTYSGQFTLRLTPEEHRKLALAAAEQHVSINKLAESRILSPVGA